MKKIRICLFICLILLGLTACNRPDNAKKLIKNANQKYGTSTMVSKTKKSDGGYTVVLHDSLQDFDYTVTSGRGHMWFFQPGKPFTTDDFAPRLVEKIAADEQTELNKIRVKYNVGITTETAYAHVCIHGDEPNSAKQAALEVAQIFQKNNLNNRLNLVEIEAISFNSYDYSRIGYATNETVGYYTLPTMAWSGKDQELLAKYTDLAKQLDSAAVYVRSETTTFAKTGFDLDEVSGYPNYEDSQVTLYYFKAFDGKEFYVADFFVFNENDRTEIHVANNYKERN